MDLTLDQSKQLAGFVQDWFAHPLLELEATFGKDGAVDSTTFLHIAQRIRAKGWTVLAQQDYLNILTPNQIRFTLDGLGIIQSYCRDDNLEGKDFTSMMKDRASSESNVNLHEYHMRFKVRREEPLGPTDPRILDLIKQWPTLRKAFRLIRRWSFEGHGIRVDLSMVRQSPYTPSRTPGRKEYQWSQRFLQHNVLMEPPRYEVEVELLHGTEHTATAEAALKSLIRGCGEVLRAIQKNSLLIRASVAERVRSDYRTLTGSDKFRDPVFRGVGPVTLQVKNMTKDIQEEVPNIRTGYNVTDKADGLRAMGMVDASGELFLLDQSLNVYRTGLQNVACANSMVDGEWVTMSHDKRAIHHYLLFDIYYEAGRPVSRLPFATFTPEGQLDGDGMSRYARMKNWYALWTQDTKTVVPNMAESSRLMIMLKRFEFAAAFDESVFTRCATRILETKRIYHTDGLILTSNTEPLPDRAGVRFKHQFKWKPAIDNTVDFLIVYEKDPDEPALDKVTTSIDPSNNQTIQYKTMSLYVGGETSAQHKDPRSTILRQEPLLKEGDGPSRYQPILFTPTDYADTMAHTCHRILEVHPETGEQYIMTKDSHEPIPPRSIVEMRYDPTRESGWRWIPSRIRHDKTERLLRAMKLKGAIVYKGMMNDSGVANDVWNSIHDPVTVSMIQTGNEQPTLSEVQALVHSRETDITKKYYERKAPKENMNLVKGLQDFHNKYIKNRILLKSVLKGGKKNLLDMACGKGGDLYKWIFNRANIVIGMDQAGENITNSDNGAYKRYVEALTELGPQKVPLMAFIIGDSSKSIVTGEAGAGQEEQDMLRSIFGRAEPKGPLPPYIQTKLSGSFREGADVAACMFAIHYFFESSTMLDGFLQNLSDTVKMGGYFTGCCFDGDRVFQMLQSVEKGHARKGWEGDVPLWSITKSYDQEHLTEDDASIGLAIDVEFISIGSTHREYLVPFALLQSKLADIGFRLLTKAELAEIGLGASTNTFDISYQMAEKGKQPFPMSASVKEFSFLNRWFIFKRQDAARIPATAAAAAAATAATAATATATAATAIPMNPVVAEDAVLDDEKEEPIVPAAQRTLTVNEVFLFGPGARIADFLQLKDPYAGRWLSLSAPFPIPDPERPAVLYPSVEHYMAAMRLARTATPAERGRDLAVSLFSREGSIHQKFLQMRLMKKVERKQDQLIIMDDTETERLLAETKSVKDALLKKSLIPFRLTLNDAEWNHMKENVLREALAYRWERDARFHGIVEAARTQGKYLLYSQPATNAGSEWGGQWKSGRIVGENKVGHILMKIAGFSF
jgi:predicted NAD-dependent protein-ADP-ribosyltransferase YbiA (DUF1768 family)